MWIQNRTEPPFSVRFHSVLLVLGIMPRAICRSSSAPWEGNLKCRSRFCFLSLACKLRVEWGGSFHPFSSALLRCGRTVAARRSGGWRWLWGVNHDLLWIWIGICLRTTTRSWRRPYVDQRCSFLVVAPWRKSSGGSVGGTARWGRIVVVALLATYATHGGEWWITSPIFACRLTCKLIPWPDWR